MCSVSQPREFTCQECEEGLQWVGAYMTDPLWVAEYTFYLEETFCPGQADLQTCVDLVKEHFPAMHSMTVERFWDPAYLCQLEHQCQPSTEYPTQPPTAGQSTLQRE